MVEIKYFNAEFTGTLTPASEIEELGWLTSKDKTQTTATGELCSQWLQEQTLID